MMIRGENEAEKKKSNKNTVDSEILRYVIALAAITVTLVAARSWASSVSF